MPSSDPTVFLNIRGSLPTSHPASGDPHAFHTKLPGYEQTPLRVVPHIAERLGIRAAYVKDESSRLGLPAFKMLGASWASYRSILERTGIDPDGWQTVEGLALLLEPHLPLTLATATDGNHGRAIARMAKLLGLQARIWVPEGTVPSRVQAIESEGAAVTVTPGSYDDAVAEAASAADDRTLVVSDTSWPGYDVVPRWVVDGYSTMLSEIALQLAQAGLDSPTVVPAPIGVGALAAALVMGFRDVVPRPIIIGAEPTHASCVLAALKAGRIVTVPGPHETSMAGLSCGTASAVAFPVLKAGLDATVAFDDEWAAEAMRLLAAEGIVAGESGAATLGALLCLADRRPDLRGRLGLGPHDVALIIVTEGATDPVNYERVVGKSPDEVPAH